LWRHAFTASGPQGLCPLDAELSLPARGDSDLRQEGAVDGTTDESSRESQTVLERILGWSLSAQAIDTSVADAAGEVRAFDEQPAEPPAPAPEQTILVVQADGQGVPMVPASPAAPSVHLSKGQKRGQKKAAVVTGLSTIAPYRRTPQEVVAALRQDPGRPEAETRPTPVGKELRATLEGKSVAMTRLVQRVAPREGPQIQHRVALTMDRVVSFAAVVDGRDVRCAISFEALMDHFGADFKDPRPAFIANRRRIEQLTAKLITQGRFESDGTILIRNQDI
jgi:hypothetical protein